MYCVSFVPQLEWIHAFFSLYEHCYAMLGTIVKVEEVSCISHTVGLVGCCVTNGVFSTCFSGYVKHTNNIL